MNTEQIVAYVLEKHLKQVSPNTVKNWQKRGRLGHRLSTVPSEEALEAFIREANALQGRGRPTGYRKATSALN